MENKMLIFSGTLVSTLLGRILYFGASLGDAIALVGLSALFAYLSYLSASKEEPVNESVKKKLNNLEIDVSNLKSKWNISSLRK